MFYATSDKKISLKKSSIAFSAGVDEKIAQKMSKALGIHVKAQLEKYLGVPLSRPYPRLGEERGLDTGLRLFNLLF